MKNTWVIVRIVCALIAIFAMGIWIGRVTAPESVAAGDGGRSSKGNPVAVDENGRQRGSRADKVTVQVVRRYKTELDLTQEQLEEMRPLFMAAGQKMVRFPAYSEQRIDILRQFHKDIEPLLDENQREKLKVLRPGGK